jgi:hypothetical protein
LYLFAPPSRHHSIAHHHHPDHQTPSFHSIPTPLQSQTQSSRLLVITHSPPPVIRYHLSTCESLLPYNACCLIYHPFPRLLRCAVNHLCYSRVAVGCCISIPSRLRLSHAQAHVPLECNDKRDLGRRWSGGAWWTRASYPCPPSRHLSLRSRLGRRAADVPE